MERYNRLFIENSGFYYIYGNKGMTSSGSFTSDKSRWIIFDKNEKERFEKDNIKPYGATKKGIFVDSNKF